MCPTLSTKKAVPLFSRRIATGSGERTSDCGAVLSGARTGIHHCAVAGPTAKAAIPPNRIRHRSITPHRLSSRRRRVNSRCLCLRSWSLDAAPCSGRSPTSQLSPFVLGERGLLLLGQWTGTNDLNGAARILGSPPLNVVLAWLVLVQLVCATIAKHFNRRDIKVAVAGVDNAARRPQVEVARLHAAKALHRVDAAAALVRAFADRGVGINVDEHLRRQRRPAGLGGRRRDHRHPKVTSTPAAAVEPYAYP